jgi:hypothetical protein
MVGLIPAVSLCSLPRPSVIATHLDGATFHDSYATSLRVEDLQASATELALLLLSRVPGWIEFLMRMRNHIVGLMGLKNQGSFTQGLDAQKTAAAYQVGDRIGFFTVMYVSDDEFIIGDDDKHLDVEISICIVRRCGAAQLVVSTVVREHNWLGRTYMFFVGPAHKVIAPATLRYGYRQK